MGEVMSRCDDIQDLLPLYIDGLTSEDSSRLIEEHIASCPGCVKVLKRRRRQRWIRPLLAGIALLLLLGCVLWLNVPRRVELAVDAVVFDEMDGSAQTTKLHIEGKWTPNWFGGFDATFSGAVYVDRLPITEPETHSISDMEFSSFSAGEHCASAFIMSNATDTQPYDVVGTLWLYRNSERNATVVCISEWMDESGWIVVANCTDQAQARATLDALPIVFDP